MTDWLKEKERARRLEEVASLVSGKVVQPADVTALLERIICSGDRVCLEGDNQKQADFLAECLTRVDPSQVHDLHIVQSGLVLSEHLDLFRLGLRANLISHIQAHSRAQSPERWIREKSNWGRFILILNSLLVIMLI